MSDYVYKGAFDRAIERQFPKYVGKKILWRAWCTGGASGGNCWNDNPPQHFSRDDPVPDFDELDEYLTANCPNITFLQFRKLEKELVHDMTYQEHEYYGNYSDYMCEFVVVEELEKFISDLNK